MALSNDFPSWGETGTLPSSGFFYEGGDQVNEKHMDALWHNLNQQFNEIVNQALVADGSTNVKGDITDDNANTIFDYSNSWVPLAILEASTFDVSAGGGLSGGGSSSLGSSVSVSHADTSSQGSNSNFGGGVVLDGLSLDGYGHVTGFSTKDHDSRYDNYSSWTFEEGDGESTAVSSGERAVVSGGTDLNTELVGTNPPTIEVRHNDTSSQGSVDTSGDTIIDSISLDGRGHVTGISTRTKSGGAAPATYAWVHEDDFADFARWDLSNNSSTEMAGGPSSEGKNLTFGFDGNIYAIENLSSDDQTSIYDISADSWSEPSMDPLNGHQAASITISN